MIAVFIATGLVLAFCWYRMIVKENTDPGFDFGTCAFTSLWIVALVIYLIEFA